MHSNASSFETLIDFVEGRLPGATVERVTADLAAADAAVHSDLAWLQSFDALRQAGALEPVPDRVRDHLRQRFRRWTANRPAQPGLLQRIQATLRFDSLGAAAAAGVRDLQTDPAMRQYLFESGRADVELYVYRHVTGARLYGQVLPPEWEEDLSGWVVSLRDATGEMHYSVTNHVGEFRFFDIFPGSAQVIILADGREIILANVALA